MTTCSAKGNAMILELNAPLSAAQPRGRGHVTAGESGRLTTFVGVRSLLPLSQPREHDKRDPSKFTVSLHARVKTINLTSFIHTQNNVMITIKEGLILIKHIMPINRLTPPDRGSVKAAFVAQTFFLKVCMLAKGKSKVHLCSAKFDQKYAGTNNHWLFQPAQTGYAWETIQD